MADRYPQSRFEKFLAGLEAIKQMQPSAKFSIKGGSFYIGNATDPFLTSGMKQHLDRLGFTIVDDMFVFDVNKSG